MCVCACAPNPAFDLTDQATGDAGVTSAGATTGSDSTTAANQSDDGGEELPELANSTPCPGNVLAPVLVDAGYRCDRVWTSSWGPRGITGAAQFVTADDGPKLWIADDLYGDPQIQEIGCLTTEGRLAFEAEATPRFDARTYGSGIEAGLVQLQPDLVLFPENDGPNGSRVTVLDLRDGSDEDSLLAPELFAFGATRIPAGFDNEADVRLTTRRRPFLGPAYRDYTGVSSAPRVALEWPLLTPDPTGVVLLPSLERVAGRTMLVASRSWNLVDAYAVDEFGDPTGEPPTALLSNIPAPRGLAVEPETGAIVVVPSQTDYIVVIHPE